MQQPENRNFSILDPGTPHATVIGTWGMPENERIDQGTKVELFHFKEGYAKEVKVLRAAFHITADAFTFGMREPFGILFENWASGIDVRLRVHYDAQDRVKTFDILSNEKTLLVTAPAKIPPVLAEVSLSPSVTSVLMPHLIAATLKDSQ